MKKTKILLYFYKQLLKSKNIKNKQNLIIELANETTNFINQLSKIYYQLFFLKGLYNSAISADDITPFIHNL